MFDPDAQLERAALLMDGDYVVKKLISMGGGAFVSVKSPDRMKVARELLLSEGVIITGEDGAVVCTPRAWSYEPNSKINSTFTLTTRTGLALAQIANALGEEQAEIEGFEMLAPVSVSKSGVIDIAVAILHRKLGLEVTDPGWTSMDPRDQP